MLTLQKLHIDTPPLISLPHPLLHLPRPLSPVYHPIPHPTPLNYTQRSATWKGEGKLLSRMRPVKRTRRTMRSTLAMAILPTGFTRRMRSCSAFSLRRELHQVAAWEEGGEEKHR